MAKTPRKSTVHRQVKKRRARRARPRWPALAWLSKRLPKSLRALRPGHPVTASRTAAFAIILGLAIGAGYWGAKALFGAPTPAPPSATQPYAGRVIQQGAGPSPAILPEEQSPGARAYEEHVAEEVYIPSVPPQRVPAEVASLQPPAHTLPQDAPLWRLNAVPFAPHGGAPMLAIVIDDMGVDRTRSRRMWEEVPAPLTLSFLTYASDLPTQTAAARARGHELMLHMSMEPTSAAVDPGPNVLMSAMPDAELKALADWGLQRFEGFVGVNNHMGSRFTEDPRAMRVVLEEVQRRGLLFLDSRTSPKSAGARVARELGMAVLERNVFLDNVNEPAQVLKQLQRAEAIARQHGHAIAIGHPRDATLEVLKTWVPEARARGLQIVPVTALLTPPSG